MNFEQSPNSILRLLYEKLLLQSKLFPVNFFKECLLAKFEAVTISFCGSVYNRVEQNVSDKSCVVKENIFHGIMRPNAKSFTVVDDERQICVARANFSRKIDFGRKALIYKIGRAHV